MNHVCYSKVSLDGAVNPNGDGAKVRQDCTQEAWLRSFLNDFIARLIPVYLQLTEGGHLRNTPLDQLCN